MYCKNTSVHLSYCSSCPALMDFFPKRSACL